MINKVESRFKKVILFFFIVQLVWVFYIINQYYSKDYLQLPFMVDKNDTLMDLFNTLYWSMRDDMYSVWGSIYPPFVFLVLKFSHQLYYGDVLYSGSLALREDGWSYALAYVTLQLVSLLAVFFLPIYRKFDFFSKLCLSVFFILSGPVLFALERGNLILFCPLLWGVALSYPGLTQFFFFSLLTNLKPYFFILQLNYLLSKEYASFILSVSISAILFTISGIILVPDFYLFLFNIFGLASKGIDFDPYNILSMTSSLSVLDFISHWWDTKNSYYVSEWDNFFENNVIRNCIQILIYMNYFILLCLLVCALILARFFNRSQLIALLSVLITNLSYQIGGYSLCLYIALFPVFMTFKYKKIVLLILLVLFSPLDFFVILEDTQRPSMVFLSDKEVWLNPDVGLGAILRPILNATFMIIMIAECINIYLKINIHFATFEAGEAIKNNHREDSLPQKPVSIEE